MNERERESKSVCIALFVCHCLVTIWLCDPFITPAVLM